MLNFKPLLGPIICPGGPNINNLEIYNVRMLAYLNLTNCRIVHVVQSTKSTKCKMFTEDGQSVIRKAHLNLQFNELKSTNYKI